MRRFTPNPMREMDPFDGILLFDKPAGPTSHDIVDEVRHHLRIKKAGHGGTLDPNATGLLIMLLGRGTKLSNFVMGSDKTYEGVMKLGVTTDSQDVDGQVLETKDATGVTREALEEAMKKFIGDFHQLPPMVSAIKVKGVPLYKLARKGETIEREPRLVHVYEFRILDFAPPEVRFVLKCTKGTYVRTICHDIGQALGCGAHLASLRRTRSGDFDVKDAMTLADFLAAKPDDIIPRVLPMTSVRTPAAI